MTRISHSLISQLLDTEWMCDNNDEVRLFFYEYLSKRENWQIGVGNGSTHLKETHVCRLLLLIFCRAQLATKPKLQKLEREHEYNDAWWQPNWIHCSSNTGREIIGEFSLIRENWKISWPRNFLLSLKYKVQQQKCFLDHILSMNSNKEENIIVSGGLYRFTIIFWYSSLHQAI